MQNSLLIALSRQVALQRSMDVIANNMANMNTSGYKADQALFEEYIMPVANMTDGVAQDRALSYVDTAGLYRDYATGDMAPTGNDLDVAISGKGWFSVETPEGERYTRNGELKINSEGILVTVEGHPVLGEGGQITFDSSETNITITKDGTISSSAGEKGRLRVSTFENEGRLNKVGLNLYEPAEGEEPQPATEAQVMQGMIEKSNVKPVLEMSRMIETMRAYTSVARSLDQMQELREEAIDTLGDTNAA